MHRSTVTETFSLGRGVIHATQKVSSLSKRDPLSTHTKSQKHKKTQKPISPKHQAPPSIHVQGKRRAACRSSTRNTSATTSGRPSRGGGRRSGRTPSPASLGGSPLPVRSPATASPPAGSPPAARAASCGTATMPAPAARAGAAARGPRGGAALVGRS